MLYPSIDELLKITDSKYTLVTIASQRARKLLDEKQPLEEKRVSHTYVGLALEELYEGKIKHQVK